MHTRELENKGVPCEIFSENLGSIHMQQNPPLSPQFFMKTGRYLDQGEGNLNLIHFSFFIPTPKDSQNFALFFSPTSSLFDPFLGSLHSNHSFCPRLFVVLRCVFSLELLYIITELSCQSTLNQNDTFFERNFQISQIKANLHYHPLPHFLNQLLHSLIRT